MAVAERAPATTADNKPFRVPGEGAVEGSGGFANAPELEEIGGDLIEMHPKLQHLQGVPLVYQWKAKGGTKRGWGFKVPEQWRERVGCEVGIWIAADHARNQELTTHQVKALVYHELRTIQEDYDKDGEFKGYVIRRPEIEAWTDELAAFGAWNPSLQRAGVVFSQLDNGQMRFDPVEGAD